MASTRLIHVRVAATEAAHAAWSAPGAGFLTPSEQHEADLHCYIRDPDGRLNDLAEPPQVDSPAT
jgi:hypothetical protein